MRRIPSRRRPGSPAIDLRAIVALAVLVLPGTGCNYGFEGGGFPPHIQTIYVELFENDTPQFDLTQRLHQRLVDELPRRLGVRLTGQETADAIVVGEIRRYDDMAQNLRLGPGNQPVSDVLEHQVQIGVSARVIDVRENVIRWEGTITGRGTYRPDSEQDDVGKTEAIENLLEQIVDGAQSQW